MHSKPFSKMRQLYNILSEDQKRIADFILENKAQSVMMTISEIAGACSLSETTVVRFMNKLQYTSYQVFRLEMAQELSEISSAADQDSLKIEDGYQSIGKDDSVEDIRKKVVFSAAAAVQDIDKHLSTESLETAGSYLLNANRIMFYGSGGSTVIALDGHHKFLRLGLTSIHESNAHFAIIRAAHLNKDDVLVLISHTGDSREVLDCAANAKGTGCRIIGITSYIHSGLAQVSDVVLFSSTNDLAYYTDAMVSRLLQLVILDMLFISVSLKMGHSGKEAIEKSRQAISAAKRSSKDNRSKSE